MGPGNYCRVGALVEGGSVGKWGIYGVGKLGLSGGGGDGEGEDGKIVRE